MANKMSTSNVTQEPRRFAVDRSGVLHQVVDYRPGRDASYRAACGVVIKAAATNVVIEGKINSIICRACRNVMTAVEEGQGSVRN